jgi:hypothetical protein
MGKTSIALIILIIGIILLFIAIGLHSNYYHYYPSPTPSPHNPPSYGGCAGTRYGCCPDGNTPKMNMMGSNCR